MFSYYTFDFTMPSVISFLVTLLKYPALAKSNASHVADRYLILPSWPPLPALFIFIDHTKNLVNKQNIIRLYISKPDHGTQYNK